MEQELKKGKGDCEDDERKRIKEKGKRRKEKWPCGDCEADERKRIKQRPSGLVTSKPHNLITLIKHLLARCIALITLKP